MFFHFSLISSHILFKFIESYVELMILRFSEAVTIQLNMSDNPPNLSNPALLFTNKLENAFKYGISYDEVSVVHIS